MTVPESPTSNSPAIDDAGHQLVDTSTRWRGRRETAVVGGLGGVALAIAVLVYVFPNFAIPLGTALAFVAVIPPLAQWLSRR